MAISYEITRLPDGKYKCIRANTAQKASTPVSFDHSELEIYLKDSVSKPRLEDALRTLDSTGRVTVEADVGDRLISRHTLDDSARPATVNRPVITMSALI